jgi:hypothetical protein
LILPIFGYCFSLAQVGEKYFGIKRGFNALPHKAPFIFFSQGAALSPDEGRARQGDYSDSNAQMKVGNWKIGLPVKLYRRPKGSRLLFLLAVMSRHKRVADRAPIIG